MASDEIPPLSGYLSSEEASEALGVKRATLYSYASRGLVRIAPARDGRKRMYLAADVEALRVRAAAAKGHGPAAAGALDWGQPVLESAITSIDVDGPNYRGVPALTLAEQDTPYEAVAHLLWGLSRPEQPPRFLVRGPGLDPAALVALLPPNAPVHAVLACVVPALAASDPLRHAVSESAELSRATRLLRRMAASLALVTPGHGSRDGWADRLEAALAAPTVADAVVAALGGGSTQPGAARRLVDRALVVCADHELNASSFAARVAAGTGADLYACVQAALATLSGPLHGGASDRVEAMLDEAPLDDPEAWLGERLRRGEDVPGLGHRLYPAGDPRALALLEWSRAGGAPPERLRRLVGLWDAVDDAGLPPPNLDFGLVAAVHAAGLPAGSAAALFAVGRCAGWVAHTREQRAAGHLLRPRARYVGP